MRPSDPASTTAASSGLEVCVARAKGSGIAFSPFASVFLFIYDPPVSGEKGISHAMHAEPEVPPQTAPTFYGILYKTIYGSRGKYIKRV